MPTVVLLSEMFVLSRALVAILWQQSGLCEDETLAVDSVYRVAECGRQRAEEGEHASVEAARQEESTVLEREQEQLQESFGVSRGLPGLQFLLKFSLLRWRSLAFLFAHSALPRS